MRLPSYPPDNAPQWFCSITWTPRFGMLPVARAPRNLRSVPISAVVASVSSNFWVNPNE